MRALLVLAVVTMLHGLFAQTPGWTQATAAAQWSGRNGHCVVVFNNKMWLLGGWQTATPTYCTDVWSSSDGVTWTLETATAWPGRAQFAAVVYDNKIWVFGGWDGTRRNDVWYSSDGVSWTQAPTPGWTGRNGHYAMVHDNKMWVVAGLDTTLARKNDVWSSTDGITWTQETAAAQFVGISHGDGCEFDGKLWVAGGLTTNNQAWSSSDGITWTNATMAAQWPARYAHQMISYNNRVWVLGGYTGSAAVNDVWASTDGANWTSEPAPGWSARQYAASVVYDNKLWMIGGMLSTSARYNDVWYYSESTPPQITSTPPANVTVGDTYNYTITATGVPAPTISVTGLPAWLNQVGDSLTGVPGPGDLGLSPTITVTADSTAGTASQMFDIDVLGIPPAITSAPVTDATVGILYTYTVAATGVPAPTLMASGLPAWLTFTPATGELAGTPTVTDIGLSAPISITAANSWQPDDVQTFQIQVNGVAPLITSTPPASVTVGQLYTYNITTTGDPAPSLIVSGNPSWLTLAGDVLSGTPPGSAFGITGMITITAANGWAPDDVQSFTIDVQGIPPTFTSTPVLTATPGSLYSYIASATGTPAPGLAVTSALPSWLAFDSVTGELSGTPSNNHARTSVDVTIEASNAIAPDAVQTFTIEVGRSPDATKSEGGGGCAATGGPAAAGLIWILMATLLRRRREG